MSLTPMRQGTFAAPELGAQATLPRSTALSSEQAMRGAARGHVGAPRQSRRLPEKRKKDDHGRFRGVPSEGDCPKRLCAPFLGRPTPTGVHGTGGVQRKRPRRWSALSSRGILNFGPGPCCSCPRLPSTRAPLREKFPGYPATLNSADLTLTGEIFPSEGSKLTRRIPVAGALPSSRIQEKSLI